MISNPSRSLEYVELDGSDSHTQVANNAWENWDMSGFLPAGALYVVVQGNFGSSASRGVRKDGSSDSRLLTDRGPIMITEVGTGLIVETYAATGITFSCTGYFF